MGFRFRRRLRVMPGVTLNLNKTGVSTSIGVRGAHITTGTHGTRTTVGIPGTGMYWTEKLSRPAPASTTAVIPLPVASDNPLSSEEISMLAQGMNAFSRTRSYDSRLHMAMCIAPLGARLSAHNQVNEFCIYYAHTFSALPDVGEVSNFIEANSEAIMAHARSLGMIQKSSNSRAFWVGVLIVLVALMFIFGH